MAKFDNIISKEFENLDFVAKKEKNNYISAVPFPNIVFKNYSWTVLVKKLRKRLPKGHKTDKNSSWSTFWSSVEVQNTILANLQYLPHENHDFIGPERTKNQ